MKTVVAEMADLFSRLKLPMSYPEGAPNVEPRDPVRITELAPIVIGGAGRSALISRPWCWKGPHGKPGFNFKSEGRRFLVASRCLIPTDGFYDFTTAEPPSKLKTKWLFTMPAAPLFFVAGYMPQDAWTMLTVAPGPDVAPIHDRQIVVLNPEQGAAWLNGASEAEIL